MLVVGLIVEYWRMSRIERVLLLDIASVDFSSKHHWKNQKTLKRLYKCRRDLRDCGPMNCYGVYGKKKNHRLFVVLLSASQTPSGDFCGIDWLEMISCGDFGGGGALGFLEGPCDIPLLGLVKVVGPANVIETVGLGQQVVVVVSSVVVQLSRILRVLLPCSFWLVRILQC